MNTESKESSKYYARPQMADARGPDLPTRGLAGRQTAATSKHSLCYFSLFSVDGHAHRRTFAKRKH